MKRTALLLLLVYLTACAEPKVQPFSEARHNIVLREEGLTTSDGVILPVRQWKPTGKPKAVIVALHGMNDYGNAFRMPGEFLSKQGIQLYAYDQRGFGSSPSRGIWAGEENLTRDLRDMVEAVTVRHADTPVYILGESMGGAVAIAALSRPGFIQVDGVILSAPAVWGGGAMNPFYRGTVWFIAHTWPEKIFTGEGLKILASDNIPMLRELAKDPLVIKGARADSMLGLVRLMGKAYDQLHTIKTPMLLLYGRNDQVIPRDAIEGAKQNLSSSGFLAALYPNGYHMLLRDLGRDIPTRDVQHWVLDNRQRLSSGLHWPELAENLTDGLRRRERHATSGILK